MSDIDDLLAPFAQLKSVEVEGFTLTILDPSDGEVYPPFPPAPPGMTHKEWCDLRDGLAQLLATLDHEVRGLGLQVRYGEKRAPAIGLAAWGQGHRAYSDEFPAPTPEAMTRRMEVRLVFSTSGRGSVDYVADITLRSRPDGE